MIALMAVSVTLLSAECAEVEGYLEALRGGRSGTVAALFSPDAVYRDRTFEYEAQGRGPIRQVFVNLFSGLSDMDVEVGRSIGAGTECVIEWTIRGVHSGTVLGVAPSGRSLAIGGLSVIRWNSSGEIEEVTDYLMRSALERQLGSGGDGD